MNILLVWNRHHHRLFIVYFLKYIIDDKSIPISFTFVCNWIDWTGLGLGLGLVFFGLGLITVFWSRSRTLWSRSWPWFHYVPVPLTSLAWSLMTAVLSRKQNSRSCCLAFCGWLRSLRPTHSIRSSQRRTCTAENTAYSKTSNCTLSKHLTFRIPCSFTTSCRRYTPLTVPVSIYNK